MDDSYNTSEEPPDSETAEPNRNSFTKVPNTHVQQTEESLLRSPLLGGEQRSSIENGNERSSFQWRTTTGEQNPLPSMSDDDMLKVPKSPYDQPLGFQILMILCISFISFGSYFAYDAVSALEVQIRKDLDIDTFEFGLLFSVYSFPNIVLVLVGGWIIDKMGNRFSAILFCSLFTVGAAIVAVAPLMKSYWIMLIGRFVFGLGAESSYVVQNNLCIEWFSHGSHLALAMGVALTISRLGSILAFGTEAAIARYFGNYLYALFFAFLLSAFSLLTAFGFCALDKLAKRRVKFEQLQEVSEKEQHCVDPRALTVHYWLWVLIGVTIYSTIFPFLALSSGYVAEKWHTSSENAGLLLGFIDLTSLVMSPIFGWIVDKTGKRGYLVILGNSFAVAGYFLLGATRLFPIFGIMLLGIHFSLMPAALWPCVPLLVKSNHSGLAFAIISALINASLTGIDPLLGYIADRRGFEMFCFTLAAISAVSVIAALIWNYMDTRRDIPVLNQKDAVKLLMSSQERGSLFEEENYQQNNPTSVATPA